MAYAPRRMDRSQKLPGGESSVEKAQVRERGRDDDIFRPSWPPRGRAGSHVGGRPLSPPGDEPAENTAATLEPLQPEELPPSLSRALEVHAQEPGETSSTRYGAKHSPSRVLFPDGEILANTAGVDPEEWTPRPERRSCWSCSGNPRVQRPPPSKAR
eukprot:COSAG02_NODE_2570_length_8510_cov_6.332541_3_plen_157_part_00